MDDSPLQRRAFLALAAAGVAAGAAAAALDAPRVALAAPPDPRDDDDHDHTAKTGPLLKLGVASYSLRKFPRDRMIEMVKALRTPYVNLKSVHLPYELSPADLAAARKEIEDAGLQIVGGGTITFDKDTDEDVKRYFDYAKAAGMRTIVCTMDPAILPRVERFAKQYDILIAIHNHGTEDKRFPSPYDVLKHVKSMDRRMGLCIDIGHTVRTGTDVVQAVADAGPRLHDMHVKDLSDLRAKDSQVIVGEGAIPIAEIFRQLVAMRYPGYVNLEYEIDADDPLPGMKQSFAHMRGILAGLEASRVRPRAPRRAAAR
ncbi:MAG: sugar phosphate isomerase/epimerase [Gemmatimonadaceae bacterium]|nr:sugar phosphate isomerase/epimerase [Gemmatimonadaceae bacterium]